MRGADPAEYLPQSDRLSFWVPFCFLPPLWETWTGDRLNGGGLRFCSVHGATARFAGAGDFIVTRAGVAGALVSARHNAGAAGLGALGTLVYSLVRLLRGTASRCELIIAW